MMQLRKIHHIITACIVITVAGGVAGVLMPNLAHADGTFAMNFCDSNQDGAVTDEEAVQKCKDSMWNQLATSLPASDVQGTTRRGMTYDQYKGLVASCNGLMNAEYSCANAVVDCLISAVNVADCHDVNNIKTIEGITCNNGKEINCDTLKTLNDTYIDAQKKKIADSVTGGGCDHSKDNPTSVTDAKATDVACTNRYNDQLKALGCGDQFVNTEGTNSSQGSNYKDINTGLTNGLACSQRAAIASAQGTTECSARGGYYVQNDMQDTNPGGTNTTQKGCYGDTHVNTPQACSAINSQVQARGQGGTQWIQPDPQNNPSLWSCEPTKPTNPQQTPQEKGSAQCDLQYPVPDKTDKDYAKDNALNAACKSGANGHDCTEQTSSSGVSTEDLQKACKVGAANTAGAIPDTLAKPNGECQFGGVVVKTNIISCTKTDNGGTAIGEVLKIGVFILSALVGILAVGGLAWGAIKYAQAGDNQGTVSEAKEIIRNVIIGIILFGFMVAIINFLLPGGLFK